MASPKRLMIDKVISKITDYAANIGYVGYYPGNVEWIYEEDNVVLVGETGSTNYTAEGGGCYDNLFGISVYLYVNGSSLKEPERESLLSMDLEQEVIDAVIEDNIDLDNVGGCYQIQPISSDVGEQQEDDIDESNAGTYPGTTLRIINFEVNWRFNRTT